MAPPHLCCFSLSHGSSPALLSRTAPGGGGYGGFAVSLGLGEMVMVMFAAAGGDVVRGGCGCGRLVLPWVWESGVAVGLGGRCCRGLVVWLEC
uniref:Uncharacterized protein n=1 Tax=Fagus sylvatica TaxID=28930 RepID=A0A2N9IVG6_FAGSY